MNDNQTKALNEFRDIQGVFENYQGEIDKYAIVSEKVATFNNNIEAIGETARSTASNTTGVTKSKGATKRELAVLCAELAAAAMSYAADQQDAELEGIFDVTYSDLYYAKDEDSLNMATMLLEELDKMDKETLDRYLIFAEDRDHLRELTDQFEGISKTQGGKVADSIAAHRKLKVLFKETNSLLRNSLDRLLLRLKRKEPDMVDAYFNVRSQGNIMIETEHTVAAPVTNGVE